MELEKDDIQALIFSAFPKNPCAAYVLLECVDAAASRAWIGKMAGLVTVGERREYGTTMNVALSARGLAALGTPDAVLRTFSREFREGMSSVEHRSRVLGDTGDSAPAEWQWGGPKRSAPHVVLMLYARDDASLAACLAERRREYEGALREVFVRDTNTLPDRREHFGFADGIAQPSIQGGRQRKPGESQLKAGELLLGYPNEYDKLPVSPSASANFDPGGHLLPSTEHAPPGSRDVGRNGTYLVIRQLEQDVEGFWRAMENQSRGPSGEPNRDEAVRLAAKCVGRWPSGAPLVKCPDRDDPKHADDDDFMYRDSDLAGFACPVGSHIRRTNPRDSLEPNGPQSLTVVNRHRILRRGRSYGPLLERFATEHEKRERGLFFVCANANIRRQFEFIQQTWSNNGKFDGLYEDKDPLIGDQPAEGGVFTIPEHPVRRRLGNLPRFVRVRGGEYFFLPSVRALRFLGAMPGA